MDEGPILLDVLRARAKKALSDKRYAHTLGVERAVTVLGERMLPDAVTELRAAALLHDITKEYTEQEHVSLAAACGTCIPESIRAVKALLHSFTAPLLIRRDMPEVSDERILAAIACHTAGKEDMSVFDKILFIADYIEDGRTYPSCVAVRERLLHELSQSGGSAERALDEAVLAALDHTVNVLVARGSRLSIETVLARNALLGAISRD